MDYAMMFPRKVWEAESVYHCTKEELDLAEKHPQGIIKTVGGVDYMLIKNLGTLSNSKNT